jgi:hypothetical protein
VPSATISAHVHGDPSDGAPPAFGSDEGSAL